MLYGRQAWHDMRLALEVSADVGCGVGDHMLLTIQQGPLGSLKHASLSCKPCIGNRSTALSGKTLTVPVCAITGRGYP